MDANSLPSSILWCSGYMSTLRQESNTKWPCIWVYQLRFYKWSGLGMVSEAFRIQPCHNWVGTTQQALPVKIQSPRLKSTKVTDSAYGRGKDWECQAEGKWRVQCHQTISTVRAAEVPNDAFMCRCALSAQSVYYCHCYVHIYYYYYVQIHLPCTVAIL